MPHLESSLMMLVPLGAGDLIDRTIRLYRRHFVVLVRMSVPPVVVSAAGAVLWTLGVRGAGVTDSSSLFAAYVALAAVGAMLQAGGVALYVVVMGGATRNLVGHLLSGERLSVRGVYGSVRRRFWRLAGATLVLGAWLGFVATVAAFVWVIIIAMMSVGIAGLGLNLVFPEWLIGGAVVLVILLAGVAALWVFFYFGGLLAYVLQAMMVEGRGVFAAVSRSIALARGHLRRLAAMFFFTTFASYAAWLLMITPLLYVGIAQGYSLNPFGTGEDAPVWYEIGYQVMWQASAVLLAPVWMLGLSLLYVDERVRQEGYDIELAAARVFGDMPTLAQGQVAPLASALAPEANP